MDKSRGYTTLQLVMVIVLLGLMAAVTLVRFPSYTTIQTEGLWGVFINDLRYTAMLAISENACYYMVIGTTSYSIFDPGGNDITPSDETAVNPYTSGAITTTGTIGFNGRGQPFSNSTCTTTLSANRTFAVNTGAPNTRTITIYPYTGYIE